MNEHSNPNGRDTQPNGALCTVHACARPVRSWGDYCEQHQMAFAALSVRRDTEQIESLQRWMQLPAFEGERPWAA